MINTLFSGLMIGALVVSIGAIGLLKTPSANAEPNCDKAGTGPNEADKQRGNTHCVADVESFPECEARGSNPQEDNCKIRGN